MTRNDKTRQNKMFFYGFGMLECTVVCHRQLTTKTVSLGMEERKKFCACRCLSLLDSVNVYLVHDTTRQDSTELAACSFTNSF